MARNGERPSNSVPVTVATLAGVSNLLLLAFARQYISDDFAGLVISVYAYVSVPLCAYGLVGIITEKPKFITVFANYLLLDAVAWAICRFLVAQFFFVSIFDEDICSIYSPKWNPEHFDHDIVTSVQRFRDDRIRHSMHRTQCQLQVGAFQTVVVLLLLAFTAAQGSVAMGMRRHAQELERLQQHEESGFHFEKEVLMVYPDEKAEAVAIYELV